ncbi:MAG: hypothetical protein EA400_05570 [Chromatiaceae bacterium]|nr:MAG: hypothetical protein EA400_05570 [Chromatiaceae bacterium]
MSAWSSPWSWAAGAAMPGSAPTTPRLAAGSTSTPPTPMSRAAATSVPAAPRISKPAAPMPCSTAAWACSWANGSRSSQDPRPRSHYVAKALGHWTMPSPHHTAPLHLFPIPSRDPPQDLVNSTGTTIPIASQRLALLRAMELSRAVEERLRSLYRQGSVVGGVYLGIGQEALSAAATLARQPGDIYAPLIRDSAGRLAAGEAIEDVFRCYLGRRTGHMRGRDGNVHRGDLEAGVLPMVSHLGAMLAVVSGGLLARRLRGEPETAVGIASLGDGGMATGAAHEALNAAAVLRLPLVLVVANNGWSYSTPNEQSFACADLVDRAAGYGVAGHRCDGTDPDDCLQTLERAISAARAGGGVQLVVAKLLRCSGHGEHDDARYIPEAMRAAYADPVEVARQRLCDEGLIDSAGLTALQAELGAAVDAALAVVEAEPEADPAQEDWAVRSGRSAPGPTRPTLSAPAPTSYGKAISLALAHSLAEQPELFIYGQDVGGDFGGAFKITKGLAEAFPGRVINAPISEDAIAGIGIGAGLHGAHAVLEYQFADFSTIAFNQLVNQAGTTFWRTGRTCPLTVRLPCGGTPGAGPFHSQMPEAWFSHHPGLMVVAPGTVADAYGMLRQALRRLDPVIYCEHKLLYERLRDETFDPAAEQIPLERAVIRRPGRDCTLVAWSAMLHDALAAAGLLAEREGLEVEVLDLRCLRPLDLDAVVASVSRTGRLVVASEDFPFSGIAAELCAQVAEAAFTWLDAPPRRISAADVPVPYHPALWAATRPGPQSIAAAVRQTVSF